jgi:hypothetical protein
VKVLMALAAWPYFWFAVHALESPITSVLYAVGEWAERRGL